MQDLTSTLVPFIQTTSPSLEVGPVSVGVPITVCKDQSGKEKVVVIMGSTGSGKSRLSVDLATRFSAEIINSDKMQFYDGLEISTNQISIVERCEIPHHLLGELPPDGGELTTSEFRSLASKSISEIVYRGKLPIVAGGSNSYIHALLVQHFDPETYPFSPQSFISSDLRYECCFLWVDVSDSVHFDHLLKRLDQMIESGMFKELADFYNGDSRSTIKTGIYQTIGVPEFDRYFAVYPPEKDEKDEKMTEWESERKAAYEKGVQAIKDNTWQLAKKQKERILELRSSGWDIQRLDATPSIEASSRELWNDTVLKESVQILKRFLLDH